jgi:hypothetical protein
VTRDANQQRAEWGHFILKRWLDADYQVSSDAIRSVGWGVLPVPDIINPMEAEWLADAIQNCGIKTGVGLAFEYDSDPTVEDVVASRDTLLGYNGGNSWRYVIVTSLEESFLYYKDDANRFYLLCGNAAFISCAYRCTWETARIMFFDWVGLEYHSDEEKAFLTALWNKYAHFRFH